MQQTNVEFINAEEWNSLDWLSTGGTRSKRVLQSPDGKEWYFKCSEKKEAKDGKPEKHYKYEFWSEIIAYQVGKFLGIDVLRYDVALNSGEIGCISPLMIQSNESLIEVGRYMTAINASFLPEDNATRKEYTFQLLEQTLNHFELSNYWEFFFQTILFDSIIGNTDRHQENWAFITNNETAGFISKGLNLIEEDIKTDRWQKLPGWLRWICSAVVNKEQKTLNTQGKVLQLLMTKINRIAPIYDNGSSLARELDHSRVDQLLTENALFEKYINKGLSEIHWEGKKISHFELIGNLISSSYEEEIIKAAQFLVKWDDNAIAEIINAIDGTLPADWSELCIPESRKALIIKLLSSRAKKLKQLFHD